MCRIVLCIVLKGIWVVERDNNNGQGKLIRNSHVIKCLRYLAVTEESGIYVWHGT